MTPGYCFSRGGDCGVPAAGSTIHSFRFEAAFDCQVAQLMALAREFDLMSHWNKCATRILPYEAGVPPALYSFMRTEACLPYSQ